MERKLFTLWLLGMLGTIPTYAQFITTWQTTEADESITIPTTGVGYDYTVDWGDGTVTNNHNGNATHNYTTIGIYTVSITGDFPRIYFNNQGDKDKILTIEQWGDNPWTSMEAALRGCTNLQGTYIAAPDLSNVTDMSHMFQGASSFNHTVDNWNVSNVLDMSYLFAGASSFNQPINDWNVSEVTSMSYMFDGASSFNYSLNDWDVSKVTNMDGMFFDASSFNQPIGDWDVSNVREMTSMFQRAFAFNRPLNDWNISNVSSIASMFNSATSFNQPLDQWETSKVIAMNSVFLRALAFNQPIDNWDVSNVGNMNLMFYQAESFNYPLNDWDVSNVLRMFGMFEQATSFDQPLNNWDVSKVITMEKMFSGATFFDQDISNWIVSNVSSMDDILINTNMSTENYDALLIAWSQQELQNDVQFDISASYCSEDALLAKEMITLDHNWTINDQGPQGQDCQVLNVTDIETVSLKIYPNPATEYVFIQNHQLTNTPIMISIIDVSGKVILKKESNQNERNIKMDVANLISGIYWVAIASEQGQDIQKLLIE